MIITTYNNMKNNNVYLQDKKNKARCTQTKHHWGKKEIKILSSVKLWSKFNKNWSFYLFIFKPCTTSHLTPFIFVIVISRLGSYQNICNEKTQTLKYIRTWLLIPFGCWRSWFLPLWQSITRSDMLSVWFLEALHTFLHTVCVGSHCRN